MAYADVCLSKYLFIELGFYLMNKTRLPLPFPSKDPILRTLLQWRSVAALASGQRSRERMIGLRVVI